MGLIGAVRGCGEARRRGAPAIDQFEVTPGLWICCCPWTTQTRRSHADSRSSLTFLQNKSGREYALSRLP